MENIGKGIAITGLAIAGALMEINGHDSGIAWIVLILLILVW